MNKHIPDSQTSKNASKSQKGSSKKPGKKRKSKKSIEDQILSQQMEADDDDIIQKDLAASMSKFDIKSIMESEKRIELAKRFGVVK